jgi:nitrite reductase/ring-hydroxylating ferredoxin subunit/uncharacterized membrane protein
MNPETSAANRPVDRLARDTRLDALADVVQPVVQRALDGDPLRKAIGDLLHGTWLGHPLHPLVTDIPIGAWTVGAFADLLALGGDERAAFAGDAATAIGVAGAFASALSGWAEWSDTKDDPRRLGIAHAACNGAAVTLYLGSLALRATKRRGAATIAALLGYACVGAGGYLGGELSYGMQLGARHTAEPIDPPTGFTRVAAVADVPREGVLRADFAGVPVLLARIGDTIHAVSAICTHRGAPLDEGTRDGTCVRCPWHDSAFSLAGGAVIEGPATFPLTAFETRVTGDTIELRLAR